MMVLLCGFMAGVLVAFSIAVSARPCPPHALKSRNEFLFFAAGGAVLILLLGMMVIYHETKMFNKAVEGLEICVRGERHSLPASE